MYRRRLSARLSVDFLKDGSRILRPRYFKSSIQILLLLNAAHLSKTETNKRKIYNKEKGSDATHRKTTLLGDMPIKFICNYFVTFYTKH